MPLRPAREYEVGPNYATDATSMQISSVQSRVICQADEWANLFPSRLSVIEAAYLYSGDERRDATAPLFARPPSPPSLIAQLELHLRIWLGGDPSQGCTCKANGNVGLGWFTIFGSVSELVQTCWAELLEFEIASPQTDRKRKSWVRDIGVNRM